MPVILERDSCDDDDKVSATLGPLRIFSNPSFLAFKVEHCRVRFLYPTFGCRHTLRTFDEKKSSAAGDSG